MLSRTEIEALMTEKSILAEKAQLSNVDLDRLGEIHLVLDSLPELTMDMLGLLNQDLCDVEVDVEEDDDEFTEAEPKISVQVTDGVLTSVWMGYADAPPWVQDMVDRQFEAEYEVTAEARSERQQLYGGHY